MNITGLDTMIIIYAMKRANEFSPPEALELRKRTVVLLDNIRKEGSILVVPTVSIWEVLTGIPKTQHGSFLAKLNDRLVPKPVDVAVAAFAADLWIRHKGLPPPEQMERKILKVDCLVVASAKMAGATAFYSHDSRCRALATLAGLDARDLPTHSTDLLLDAEIRRGETSSGLEID